MSKTIRVLIADDDRKVTDALRGVLRLDEESRFEVAIVQNPGKIIEQVRKFQPHVVVLDNRFDNQDLGIGELLPRIRGEFETIGIVIITAHRGGAIEPIAQALLYEIDGFLDKIREKDLDPDEFRKTVINAFNAHRKREERNV